MRASIVASELGVLSVESVVREQFGIEGRATGREYIIHCPNPKHPDRKPSCAVNLETGLWHCLSCGMGGDLVKLGSIVLGWDQDAVETMLRPGTVESLQTLVGARLRSAYARQSLTAPLALPAHRPGPLGELRARGLQQETLERWQVRWVADEPFGNTKARIRHCFAFPVLDSKGMLLGWVYRRTNTSYSWQPKYLNTRDMPINKIWYGLHHHSTAEHITIVEGITDVLWCDQAGVPALGLLGSQPTWDKIKLLQRHKSITLFPDYDKAGAQWTHKIVSLLGQRVPIKIARYPKHVIEEARRANKKKIDPKDLHPVDLEIALARAVPSIRWKSFQLPRQP